MATHEDSQYELVLENRQVLVIFFLAAILCGAFFALGFLAGRSSKGNAPSTQPAAVVAKPDANRKSALSPAERSAETPAASPTEPAADPKPADPASAANVDKEKDKPRTEEKAVPPPAAAAPAPAPVPAMDPGTVNLQVGAFGTRDEAEPVAALLKRKNFPVSIVPGSTDKLHHVMVGPYPAKEVDSVKKKLENEGFKPIVKK